MVSSAAPGTSWTSSRSSLSSTPLRWRPAHEDARHPPPRPAPGATFEAIGAVLPREDPVLWSYIAAGECRAIYYDAARTGGVVLDFETATRERAPELVGAFPLVARG